MPAIAQRSRSCCCQVAASVPGSLRQIRHCALAGQFPSAPGPVWPRRHCAPHRISCCCSYPPLKQKPLRIRGPHHRNAPRPCHPSSDRFRHSILHWRPAGSPPPIQCGKVRCASSQPPSIQTTPSILIARIAGVKFEGRQLKRHSAEGNFSCSVGKREKEGKKGAASISFLHSRIHHF